MRIVYAGLLAAFVPYKEDEHEGFECEVGDVADAERQDEGTGLGDVGEGP